MSGTELLVLPDGSIRCVYSETLELTAFGKPTITRASHVEPDEAGCWMADLSPVNGPLLGPFERRSDALAGESAWLAERWLPSADSIR